MSDQELEQKRKEFRETEIQNKIESYSQVSAVEFRKNTLKHHYTYKKIDKHISKFAWVLIITQALSLTAFCTLYVASYIPKTKFLVTKVLP
jgi:hypothetical protein